jgi:predicted secreted protein with PEFG-CTERM motif
MKTKTIGSLFVLFAIASMAAAVPSAYADHAKVVVENAEGSMTPGCEPDCFIPATATIDPGGEVVFTNNDIAAHTSTAGTPIDGPSGVWDSSLVMPGSSYSVTLDEAGEYPYFCMVHPWMEGLVIVEDSHAAEEAAAAEAAAAEEAAAEAAAAEQMTLSANDIVISVPESADANEVVAIDVTIGDSHVTYDIVATHNGETILDESGVHVHTGEGSHTTSALTAPASDDNPIDVTVTFQGFGMPGDDKTGPIGLTSTAQVVPEFGTIAALILVVAIASIIAITAKSKVSLMPKL